MTDPIITFENVSKVYQLGHERSNLRAALPGRWGEPRGRDTFLALDDVSFEVAEGEALGIIGHNGAGKSTALKLLAGVMAPTRGVIRRPRQIVSIIELGLGFDPDLTGLENLEYGGAFLGLSVNDIRARRDDIIAFAELEEFVDMPVKRYSTGMLARLGFSLATAVEADVFVVDEVLSVGDWGFQRRSLERMRQLHLGGSTLVLVSHNLWVVNQLCERSVLLDHGRVAAIDLTHKVFGYYLGQTPFLNDLATGPISPAEYGSEPSAAEQSASTPAHADAEAEPLPVVFAPDAEPDHDGEAAAEGGEPDRDELAAILVAEPDWRPVVFRDVHFEPDEIAPGDPVSLVGEMQVLVPVPGGRLVAAGFWEGFAGFATPDELPSECLAVPGVYRFAIDYLTMPTGPAMVTWAIAVVNEEEPDDPEQVLPTAIARANADLKVAGEVTSRPGAYLPRTWSIERLDGA